VSGFSVATSARAAGAQVYWECGYSEIARRDSLLKAYKGTFYELVRFHNHSQTNFANTALPVLAM
jgi:hypothetical protein